MLAALKQLWRYSVAMGWVETSPAAQITEQVIGARLRARSRVLTEDEIRFVLASQAPQAPVWRFLLATGLRISEAYSGHRDGDHWVVPPEASKNAEEHRVWLSPIARHQLDEAWPWPPKWQAQLVLSSMKVGWSCHDLRRTLSTRMNDQLKIPPHIVEKMLNHSLGGVMAIYNRAAYDEERQTALEAWSAWLLALVDAHPADVVAASGEGVMLERILAELTPLRRSS
jgi:integrase